MPMTGISYILGGTAMPMRSSARVSCARKYADAGGAPQPGVGLLLIEDRVPVIEAVEHLRQTERVFREHREFQRPNDLLDDFIEARRFEDERPQIVAAALARELGRAPGRRACANTPASSRPSRSRSLAKMFWARTTAYCRYGPLSPSNASASSISNAMIFVREYFTMK